MTLKRGLISLAAFFMVGFVWFIQSPAIAHAESCEWRGSGSLVMSNASNWYTTDPGGCRLNNQSQLVFGMPGYENRSATWNIPESASVEIKSAYTGIIQVAAATATVRGKFLQYGGTVNLGASNLRVTNNMALYGGTFITTNATVGLGCVPGTTPGGAFIVCTSGSEVSHLEVRNTTSFNNLTINYQSALDSDVIVRTRLTINSGASLAANSYNISLFGGPIAFSSSGTFNADTGTVSYMGSTASTFIANVNYYNLVINHSGTIFLTSSDTTVDHDLTVGAGTTLNLSTNRLNLSGNMLNSGTVTQMSGGFSTLYGTGASFGGSGVFNLNTLVIAGTGQTLGGSGTFNVTNLILLGTASASATLSGPMTISGILRIDAGATLNGGTGSITLSGASSPFTMNGVFNAGNSTVSYTNTDSGIPVPQATFYNLQLGNGGYALGGNVGVTHNFILGSLAAPGVARLTLGDFNLSAPAGSTFTNYGVINLTGQGVAKHPADYAKFTNAAGADAATYSTASDSAYITVKDTNKNLKGAAVETIAPGATTGGYVSANPYNDKETVTLTETGPATGIFRSAALPFSVAAGAINANGRLEVSGNNSLTAMYIDPVDITDTATSTANYTGASAPGAPPACAAPTVGSSPILINSGAASTTSSIVTLTLSATGATEMMLANSPDFAGASWESYTASRSGWNLSAGTGAKMVYVKFRAACGSSTGGYSASITRTESAAPPPPPPAPPGCSLPIAGVPPIQINGGSPLTGSAVVTLTLSATGATEMMLSNSSDFAGAGWETYSTNRTGWTISSGGGLKIVYVKFRSTCGIVGPYNASVTLSEAAAPPSPLPPPLPLPPPGSPIGTPLSSASQVVISDISVSPYSERAVVRFTYQFQNTRAVSLPLRVVISATNENTARIAKRLRTARRLRAGITLRRRVTMSVPRGVTYTFKVHIFNSRTRELIDMNWFRLSL